MKRDIIWTGQFKKDYKLSIKRGLNINTLDNIIRMLAAGKVLPAQTADHQLSDNWNGYRECHIEPDWLLVYRLEKNLLVLTLTRTGTHGDIFGK